MMHVYADTSFNYVLPWTPEPLQFLSAAVLLSPITPVNSKQTLSCLQTSREMASTLAWVASPVPTSSTCCQRQP